VSRFIAVLCAVAAFAPAAQAQTAVKAVVKFSPAVAPSQRVSTVRAAGGRVVRVRQRAVVARLSVRAAERLRCAMGVIAVRY
jgi:threonine dehydratase